MKHIKYMNENIKVSIKTRKDMYYTYKDFYVDDVLVCNYKSKPQYFARQRDNVRSIKKIGYYLDWNEFGLRKVTGDKNLVVGSRYKQGNSNFRNDYPSVNDGYIGTRISKPKIIELITDHKKNMKA